MKHTEVVVTYKNLGGVVRVFLDAGPFDVQSWLLAAIRQKSEAIVFPLTWTPYPLYQLKLDNVAAMQVLLVEEFAMFDLLEDLK